MDERVQFSFEKLPGTLAVLLLLAILAVSPVKAADPAPLPDANHIFLNVSNDAGVKYDEDGARFGGPANTYYILANGGGLNQLHISVNNAANNFGEVTTSTEQSGTVYVTTTGGRGYNDDNILMIAVQDPIPEDFSVRVKSAGYTWTANPLGPSGAAAGLQYNSTALDETFTKDDFIYGPQTWKPGPVMNFPAKTMPLWYGQNMNDPATSSHLMFIDMNAGNTRITPGATDNGHVKVEFSFTNLATAAAINAYSWCSGAAQSNEGGGISWTTRTGGSGSSGYRVIGKPYAAFSSNVTRGPVPLTAGFTDQSISLDALEYLWDFGDGSTSTNRNPAHTYSLPGTYSVKLTVSNALGTDEVTKTDIIAVRTPAEAANDLIAHVESLGLKPDVETGLTDKLNYLLIVLDGGKDKEAVNTLNAFTRQVRAQTGKEIDPEIAGSLTAEAQAIIRSILFV